MGFRLYLPTVITGYLNDLLQRNPLYRGRIEDVELSLWRGAYAVRGIHISRTTGAVPVPFITARSLELALEWRSLLRGQLVGRLAIHHPEVNFVDSSEAEQRQQGGEGAWMGLVGDLFPFRINTAVVSDGSVNLRTYDGPVPLNVYLSDVQITVSNLSNISQETSPFVANVHASARAMDQARCECHIQLDPASYRPTFRLSARLLNLDVTLINGFAAHYGAIDFEKGWFDMVIEADAKEGMINGYAKALFRELEILNVSSDFAEGRILEGLWEGIVSVATFLLKNQDRNQFGTLIPFEGSLSGRTQTDLLALFLNILRNAFIEAYLPRFEGRTEEGGLLQFQAPQTWDTTNGISDP
ncbi:MAG: DUF748 domain-containing protein [Verrucomicrobiales bacterium]|nr:DUF748 domain-containing protein [Verrucomicrobiales bacterium]